VHAELLQEFRVAAKPIMICQREILLTSRLTAQTTGTETSKAVTIHRPAPKSLASETSNQFSRAGESTVAVSLTLARAFLIASVLGSPFAGGDHVFIRTDLA